MANGQTKREKTVRMETTDAFYFDCLSSSHSFFFSFVIRGSLRLSFIWSSQFSLCVRYSPVNKRFKRYRPKYNPAGYRFKGEKEIGDTNTQTPHGRTFPVRANDYSVEKRLLLRRQTGHLKRRQ